jgi:transcriptional regulator with XRE-family HTH domain
MQDDTGARLRRLRENRNMTQETLAEVMGANQSRVSRIESGYAKLGVGELTLICQALDLSLEEFFNS